MKEARNKSSPTVGFHWHEVFRTGQSIEPESGLVAAESGRRVERGVSADVYGIFLWGDENVLELASGDGSTAM